MKYKSPPVFYGKEGEDPVAWVERYEKVARYNRWTDEDLKDNFEMFLDGAARKWYACREDADKIPERWSNPADPASEDEDDSENEEELGLRELFLKEFTPADYRSYYENKLRDRRQGSDETVTDYYYDMLDLCRIVNRSMREREKIDHLFRGLRPELIEKLWGLRPKTYAEFLRQAQSYQEMLCRVASRRGEWPVAVAQCEEGQEKISRSMEKPKTKAGKKSEDPPESGTLLERFEKLEKLFESVLTKMQGQGERRKPFPRRDGKPDRTPDGKPICFKCNVAGHIGRHCTTVKSGDSPSEPPTPVVTGTKASPTQPLAVVGVEPTGSSVVPILKIDLSRVVTQTVWCEGRETEAVVDTAAGVAIIDPEYADELGLTLESWTGRIVTVSGQRILPKGVARPRISDGTRTVREEVVVMAMGGIRLLLGLNLLTALGTRIQVGATPEIRLGGELPLCSLDVAAPSCRLRAKEKQEIPPRSAVVVPVTCEGTWPPGEVALVEPSASLTRKNGLSTGRFLLDPQAQPETVLITNFGNQPEWVCSGMSLGQVEPAVALVTTLGEAMCPAPHLSSDEASSEEKQVDEGMRRRISERVSTSLSEDSRKLVIDTLYSCREVFATEGEPLGVSNCAVHEIDTGSSRPLRQQPYASAWKERELINEQVEKMLDRGIIEKSTSPWVSPVVLVKKKDGSWRFCVDYRRLNAITTKDVYPLPRIEEALARLEGSAYFSIMDLESGYWQVPIRTEDKMKTAFITADGLYQFKVMPFGLCSAPATFQRMMDAVLAGYRWHHCLVYLDDIIVFSATLDEHVERLHNILECIRTAGLKVKLTKCDFAKAELHALGHVVSGKGVSPDPQKIRAVVDFPRPDHAATVTERLSVARSFVGLCSYYRRFVENFAGIARPLHDYINSKAKVVWTGRETLSFEALKESLVKATTLAFPDHELPFEIHPDACEYGIGAALVQRNEETERPIAFASRLLSQAEKNDSITEKECLAMVWAFEKFHSYVWGAEVKVVTDHHALCWLTSKRNLAGRLARWSLVIQNYAPRIVYKSGRLHADADAVSTPRRRSARVE